MTLRLYKELRATVRRWWHRGTCRFVSYPIAVAVIKALICNPIGEHRARRRSAPLFSLLDEAGIEFDAKETAIRAALLKKLFPWAYCRFIRCPRKELDRWVTIKGLENLVPLIEMPNGVLLVTCHFGPGHVAKYALSEKGYTVYNVRANDRFVRKYGLSIDDQRLPNELYIKYKSSTGFLKTMATVRDLLRRGELVTCALDGKQGISEGTELPLMGHSRTFRTALPLAAALTGARIVPYFASLNSDGSIELRFEKPFPQRLEHQLPLDYAEEFVKLYVDKLQAYCEAEPSQINLKSFMHI